jgi:predicted metalloprotease with PDZ domain
MSLLTLTTTKIDSKLVVTEKPIDYTLSMPEPQTHYIEVEMNVSNLSQDTVLLKMPVWTPGSYLVREFSRKVESVKVFDVDNNMALKVQKTDKNTWAVATKGVSAIKVSYRVYSFELSVRTTFVDDTHASINPSSVCFYVAGKKALPYTHYH